MWDFMVNAKKAKYVVLSKCSVTVSGFMEGIKKYYDCVDDKYYDCVDDQYDDCWWLCWWPVWWWLLMTSMMMTVDDQYDDKYDEV